MTTEITRKQDLELNNIIDTDSYKLSHFLLYPKNMNKMFSYLEARGGEFDTCTLFGLQYLIHRYLSKPFTQEQIDEVADFALQHGEPFNREGFEDILKCYGGHLPVRIRAIPEGLIVPVGNAVVTVESMDDSLSAWIVNYIETQLRVWGPSTVATTSREVKKTWMEFLELSSDDSEAEISFKHHDFGSRGVTCREQAALHGAAHLLSFLGSDTIAGIKLANHYYDCDMAGFSIPATEHSTMTIFGKSGERDAIKEWVTQTLVNRQTPPGVPKLTACVGDSYDIFEFCRNVCRKEILDLIRSSGGTLVIRPDSGNPLAVLPVILDILEHNLPFGSVTVNSKGFRVLPSYLRLIWGDGINRKSTRTILKHLTDLKWSASNIAFGSGGGLLNDVNRDTQKWAFKCSYVERDGQPVAVVKDPVTDPGKRSKGGRLDLIRMADGSYRTIVLGKDQAEHPGSVMNVVFDCGNITYHNTLADIRERMKL